MLVINKFYDVFAKIKKYIFTVNGKLIYHKKKSFLVNCDKYLKRIPL